MPSSATRRLRAFIRLGRFRFLGGGVLLYGLGAALASVRSGFTLDGYVLGQCAISATQLMTHYANDYFDLEADRANTAPTRWSGGSRVLPEGELSPRVALGAAIALAGVALLLDGWIAMRGRSSSGTPVLLLLALALSWQYSAPPLRLHARALGPLTAAIVVGGLTPLVGFGMQRVPWGREALLAILPIMLAQFAMILVLDLPDGAGDAQTGKRTLVVRLGARRSAWLCTSLVAATYALVPPLVLAGASYPLAWAVVATAPLGGSLVWALRGVARRRGAELAALPGRAVAWFAALVVAELAGVLLPAALHQ